MSIPHSSLSSSSILCYTFVIWGPTHSFHLRQVSFHLNEFTTKHEKLMRIKLQWHHEYLTQEEGERRDVTWTPSLSSESELITGYFPTLSRSMNMREGESDINYLSELKFTWAWIKSELTRVVSYETHIVSALKVRVQELLPPARIVSSFTIDQMLRLEIWWLVLRRSKWKPGSRNWLHQVLIRRTLQERTNESTNSHGRSLFGTCS